MTAPERLILLAVPAGRNRLCAAHLTPPFPEGMGTDVAAAGADLLHHILCARCRVRAGHYLRLLS